MAQTPRERLSKNITEITVLVVTGTWFAAMLLGVSWWLPLMLFGYIVIVPVVDLLFGDEDIEEWVVDEPVDAPDTTEPETDPLDDLRRRYANGELTDEQFERKLERLLETETLEDAADWQQRERQREPSRNR